MLRIDDAALPHAKFCVTIVQIIVGSGLGRRGNNFYQSTPWFINVAFVSATHAKRSTDFENNAIHHLQAWLAQPFQKDSAYQINN
jgi:hypothetical protein